MLYGYRNFIETDDVYRDIAEDVETRFDTSKYELDKPLREGKNKKVVGLMKDELGGKKNEIICWTKSKNLQLPNHHGSKDKQA